MKKLLALLPAATFALTACTSSSDDGASASTPVSTPVSLPTDYIVAEMGEYDYDSDGTLTITKGSCSSYQNEVLWKLEDTRGSIAKVDDDNVQINLGDGAGAQAYNFKAMAGEQFPNGSFYKTSALSDALIEGVILEEPYYSDVYYVNTQCFFQNFGEMQETMAEIAKVSKSSVTMECDKISIKGLEMKYVSHDKDGVKYTLSYAGKTSNVDHKFLYAFNKDDCTKAFKNYQQEFENGETEDAFDFELNDQDINASEEFTDVLTAFHAATGLAKSGGAASTVSEKQIKDILRAVGNRLRGRK